MNLPQCPKCGKEVRPRGHGRGKPRHKCYACGWHGTDPIESGPTPGLDAQRVEALHSELSAARAARYVITAAQNATPVWRPFFRALQSYCRHRRAQLIVIPYRYKNPTSIWSERGQHDDWWASDLVPYLYDKRVNLCPHLMLLADIKTQPTSTRPLEGFESISGGLSAIIGHPRLELRTIPTPQHDLPKLLATTGAVTEINYIPSKAGKRGEFHHTFGAVVVEIDPAGRFFMRHLNATRDGSFCDLTHEYSPDRPPRRVTAAGLVLGDMHVDFADPSAVAATFGEGGIVPTLRPKVLVWHDVMDSYARTPHHAGEVFINYAKHHTGRGNVERELDRALAFVDKHTPSYATNVFAYSNHVDMLLRWVKSTDPRLDLENCVFWARTFVKLCAETRMTDGGVHTPDPFELWAREKLKCYPRSRFLKPDESYRILGIEVGYHGHLGPSGSRGQLRAYTRIGTKVVIGHSHVPGIIEGAYQVGTTSRLQLDYAKGPSAWLHAHCIIYPNGKRSLIFIVKGAWRWRD